MCFDGKEHMPATAESGLGATCLFRPQSEAIPINIPVRAKEVVQAPPPISGDSDGLQRMIHSRIRGKPSSLVPDICFSRGRCIMGLLVSQLNWSDCEHLLWIYSVRDRGTREAKSAL